MITFQCYHPGYNTGQHMFVPASDECNRIHINIDTGSTTTTRFDHDDGGLLDLEAPQQQGWMIIKTMMIMTLANLLTQKAWLWSSTLLYLSLFWNDAETTQRANDRYKDHLDGQLANYDVVFIIMVCLIRRHHHHEVWQVWQWRRRWKWS